METDRSNRTRLRRYFGNVLLILTIGFTVLLTVQMLRRASRVVLRDDVILVLRYELVFCAGWILLALVIRLGGIRLPGRIGQLIGRILKGALMVYGVVSMVFLGSIIADGLTSDAVPCSTVAVLGMALEDGKPPRDLELRVHTAAGYARRVPGAQVIVTGGNAGENGETEARVGKRLLMAEGVPEERIRLEEKAAETRENFMYLARMVNPAEELVVVTSNYHMGRAVTIAASQGFTHVRRLPAPANLWTFGMNLMWEGIMKLDRILNGMP